MSNEILTALSGSKLDAWLDEMEGYLSNLYDDHQNADPKTSELPALLGQYTYQPDSMDLVFRLFRLWTAVSDQAESLRVLKEDGPAVLQRLDEPDKPFAQLQLSFWYADYCESFERERWVDALGETMALIESSPQADDYNLWENLIRRADSAQAFAIKRAGFNKLLALDSMQPNRGNFRAYDQATHQMRLAHTYAEEDLSELAQQHARNALAFLEQADGEQLVDYDDWLYMGNQLIYIIPEEYPRIAAGTYSRCADDMHLADRRAVEVKLARIDARSLYAREQYNEAFARAKQGHIELVSDERSEAEWHGRVDRFGMTLLHWYLQQQRYDDAAELAYESVFARRIGAGEFSVHRALEVFEAQTHQDARWALALAYASRHEDWHAIVCRNETQEEAFARYYAAAKAVHPDHPGLALLDAYQTFSDGDYQATLNLLEPIFTAPEVKSTFHAYVYYMMLCSRAKVHGVHAIFEQPIWTPDVGGWYFLTGGFLQQSFRQAFSDEIAWEDWPREQINDLRIAYYELGMESYERAFAEGNLHYKSSNAHFYSMMSNNLALCYTDKNEHQKAVDVHLKGIAISDFVEHHSGLLSNYFALEDYQAYVATADDLWQLGQQRGHSCSVPTDYMWRVAAFLRNHLDRAAETPMWIERLDQWLDGLPEQERAERYNEYLEVKLIMLRNVADHQAEDALLTVNAMRADVEASDYPPALRMLAYNFHKRGDLELALEYYDKTIASAQSSDYPRQIELAEKNKQLILDRQNSTKKPWWKLW